MSVSGEKKRVVMAVTNDLVTDRRVMRHAAALREAGCEVLLLGRNELGVKCKKGWKFYAEYNLRLCWRLLRSKADVVWANDTDTLLASYVAAKMRRKKLVMDAHELFPEVPELVGREKVKRVWERIERKLMPKCDALLTVCQSIADYYKEKYGVEMAVVRNISDCLNMSMLECWSADVKNTQTIKQSGNPALHVLLYQGCVNKGRGVDWAIDALEFLPDCRLVIAGGGDLLEEMKAYAAQKQWADRIQFLGRLKPEQLEAVTRQANVGLVMLEDMGLSYRYALPNRIGDFVAAGIPMVVSNLPEMAAVVNSFGIGSILDGTGARSLAEAVKRVLAREWSEADFVEARKDMDWNKEKTKLLECLNALML